MSRVLVVGSYPPWPGAAADATAEDVAGRMARGETVEVLSPRPSAAHHHADLRGVVGAAALSRKARGFDEVVVRLEPGLLLRSDVSRPRRVLDRIALGLVLRRLPRSTVVVDLATYQASVDAWPSRFIWTSAGRVAVPSETDRQALEVAGVPGDRVEVHRPERDGSREHDWSSEALSTRDEVMLAVRARAAAERERDAVAGTPAPPAWPARPGPAPTAGRPLSRLERLRPYGSAGKRVARRLLNRA